MTEREQTKPSKKGKKRKFMEKGPDKKAPSKKMKISFTANPQKQKTSKNEKQTKLKTMKFFPKKSSKPKKPEPTIYKTRQEARAAYRELRQKRLKQRHGGDKHDVISQVVRLWEKLRPLTEADTEQRHVLSRQIYQRLQGHVQEYAMTHDVSRVIECVLAVSAPETRSSLISELVPHITTLVKLKYAKFVVIKMLKYGDVENKNAIRKQFAGHAKGLLSHTDAAYVLDELFSEYSNAKQKRMIASEFYQAPALWTEKAAELSLKELLDSQPDDYHRSQVLAYAQKSIHRLLSKEKAILGRSLLHRIVYEYLLSCTPDERADTIDLLKEIAVEMLHTHDGARLAMQCIWHGNAKQRKAFLKSMKTHVPKVCLEEHGYLVLLAIFDSVDDTKITSKIIVSEIGESLEEIRQNNFGRKVLLYLLCHRDPRFLHPDVVQLLSVGDGNAFTKKEAETRSAELRAAISPLLIQHLVASDAITEWLLDAPSSIVLKMAMTHAEGDLSELYTSVTSALVSCSDNSLIELPHVHMLLKHVTHATNHKNEDNAGLFNRTLANALTEETVEKWLQTNRGAFTMVFLLESGDGEVTQTTKQLVLKFQKSLKTKNFPGSKILLVKMKE